MTDLAEIKNIPTVIANSSRNRYNLATDIITIEEQHTELKKQSYSLSKITTNENTIPFPTACIDNLMLLYVAVQKLYLYARKMQVRRIEDVYRHKYAINAISSLLWSKTYIKAFEWGPGNKKLEAINVPSVKLLDIII